MLSSRKIWSAAIISPNTGNAVITVSATVTIGTIGHDGPSIQAPYIIASR
jgi:hypothetical protein